MNDTSGFRIKDGDLLVLFTNPFKFLYGDAVFFQKAAENAPNKNSEVCYARNAVLLFVLGMEALINRVLDCFIGEDFPTFVKEKIRDLPLDMKWYMAPLWCTGDARPSTYEVDKEPFQSFRELIRIRNSYVHPFPMRIPLRLIDAHGKVKTVDFANGEIPHWPQTKIPKELNHFDQKSALKAKEVVDSMIGFLDGFLGGKIKKGNWWLTETINRNQ